MSHHALCQDCQNLLAHQNLPRHAFLAVRSHITNYTIYRCDHCAALLEQTESPCCWHLLPVPLSAPIPRFLATRRQS